MDLKKTIAQNLVGYRKKFNLTQDALAGRSGLHVDHISRLERETKDVNATIPTLEKLAKGLKIGAFMLLIPHSYKKKITVEEEE